MYKNLAETKEFIAIFNSIINESANYNKVQFGLAPNFLVIDAVKKLIDPRVMVFAQNTCSHKEGPFTGEISYQMLKDININGSIIGHSERRNLFAESNSFISRKAKKLLDNGFNTILCIGETLQQYSDGATANVIQTQLHSILNGIANLNFEKNQFFIAYEPVWAVSSGKVASNEDITKCLTIVKNTLKTYFDDDKVDGISLLYGGSVNEKNCTTISEIDILDGFLIGGVSLNPQSFINISKAFTK